ncbi:MAG: acetylxylan esterase [Planctomycetota bacterium]
MRNYRLLLVCLLSVAFYIAWEPSCRADVDGSTGAETLVTLDGPHPWNPPSELEEWQKRREQLTLQVQIATGLYPMPTRGPVDAQVFGRLEKDGYSIEKVIIDAPAGHRITGLLFRPSEENDRLNVNGHRPAILCPHGHGGRNQRLSEREIAEQMAAQRERYNASGQLPKIARCVTLARLGCTSFIFDMIGYEDSIQIDDSWAHRRGVRPDASSRGGSWSWHSTEAQLRLQSVMQMQTFNALRSLDFLFQLPDVDPNRVAVSGGSGGGTQTILLGILDDRIAASFPNGMVSLDMQGGCYCENASLLRIGTNNAELAAIFAPKPMGMTAADDWTRRMLNDGFPQLEQIYQLFGKPKNVRIAEMLDHPHNFNYVSRGHLYRFLGDHLFGEKGLPEGFEEQDFEPLRDEELDVWDDDHPAPNNRGVDHVMEICRLWTDQDAQMLRDREKNLTVLLNAWSAILFEHLVDHARPLTSEFIRVTKDKPSDVQASNLVVAIGRDLTKASILLKAESQTDAKRSRTLSIALHSQPNKAHSKDALHQQDVVEKDFEFPPYTYGYNLPLVVQRGHQVIATIRKHHQGEQEIEIRFDPSLGPVIAIVEYLMRKERPRVSYNNQPSYEAVSSYRDEHFLPGSMKYGGFQTLHWLSSKD